MRSASPGKSAAENARWVDPFKNGLALYTIMLNVGIGKQHVVGWSRLRCQVAETLLHRPELARPAGGQRCPWQDRKAIALVYRDRRFPRHRCCTIAALVIH